MGQLGEQQLGTDQLGSPGTIRETEEWRVRVADDIENDLYNVQVVDTANPFGNYAIAKIDDVSGTKFDTYTRGTKVEFFAKSDSGDAFTSRFVGYVVEARELDQQGADALEVECYSFDQFLRRDTVTNDQSGKSLENALKDIIQTDTPVTWDASNVTVEDPQTLTQSYRGENVENALLSLRQKSGGEDFGVNDSLEFFWRPLESEESPRDIDNSQWFNYDLPEEGKRTINEVTVFFDSGTKNVTVDNGADKDELQSALGTQDPVTLAEEVSRPDITDIDDARAVAERILEGKESILTGTVTTFGLIDARPGDIIDIVITPRGIDGEFRIAELDYRWGRGQTIITVAEKRGDQDDLLVNLSDTLKRVELDGVDRDATANTVTSTNLRALIAVTGDVDGTNYDSDAFTNVARNKMRTGWAGDGNLDIADIAVGNDDSSAARSDTDLGNELERTSATQTLPDSTTARYTGSFSTTDIREVGLFDSGGDLIARATIPETSLTASVSVTVDLGVSNDSGYGSGVVTNDGQTATRDVIADNSPALPTDYAYGDDSTTPQESDSSLGNQLTSVGLDEVLIQSASDQSSWTDVLPTFAAEDPVEISGGTLSLLQTCFTVEAEDHDRSTNSDPHFSTNFSGSSPTDGTGEGTDFNADNQVYEYDFTLNHTIPADDFELWIRWEGYQDTANSVPSTDVSINGSRWAITETGNESWNLAWRDVANNSFVAGESYGGGDLPAGDYTVKFQTTDGGGGNEFAIDVVAPLDALTRLSGNSQASDVYTFDNTVTEESDGSNSLDGPELFPDLFEVTFNEATTRRTLDTATCTQTWNDTSNNQKIELSNDGGSTFITTNNNSTATASFAGAETGVITRIGLSRFGTDTNTPATGTTGQNVSAHDLEANVDSITPSDIGVVDVRGIVQPNTINGQTIREAAELDTNGNALTRSTFADIDVGADERVISSEAFEWAND